MRASEQEAAQARVPLVRVKIMLALNPLIANDPSLDQGQTMGELIETVEQQLSKLAGSLEPISVSIRVEAGLQPLKQSGQAGKVHAGYLIERHDTTTFWVVVCGSRNAQWQPQAVDTPVTCLHCLHQVSTRHVGVY